MNQAETDMVLSMLREMRAALVALSESETDGTLGLLRQIRGELAGIRARLDSLVGIEKQLSYQGGRLSGIEKRLPLA